MRFFAALALLMTLTSCGEAAETYWVASDRLERRTCPDQKCGVVGQLFFREGVTIYERMNGWARITEPYDASCIDGKSDYVDSGNGQCTPENGIQDGKFAEWVKVAQLTANRPADPGAKASGIAKLVAQSDDFSKYEDAFVKAAMELIDSGTCKAADFEEMGGWVKSTSGHSNEPVYFTYCGGMTTANRLYLNAETGKVFR